MKKINYFFLFLFSICLNKSFGQSPQLTGCTPPTAKIDLDISNVRAKIFCGADMWWDLVNSAKYEVPKGSGKHSLFAGSLWIGGLDHSTGYLRAAAQLYRQSGANFWPGPMDTVTCSVDTATCHMFDRLWKINRQDVVNFIGGSNATSDMISYPGNGTGNQFNYLAPFYDKNGDGLYNTNDGDYPLFDFLPGSTTCGCTDCGTLHGDQAIWWVINDIGNVHPSSLGFEIQCQAFAYLSSDDDINNTTFYQYKIINMCNNQYDSTYIGFFADQNLGYPLDDYVGCDVGRGMAYCYNGNDFDSVYGDHPPAIGIDFVKGPFADIGDGKDNDHDSSLDCTWFRNSHGQLVKINDGELDTVICSNNDTIYVQARERIMMSKFMRFNNDASPTGNPNVAVDYYNYMRGIWKDGAPLTYGGNGHTLQSDTCDYMFPGNPSSDPNGWGNQYSTSHGDIGVAWDETTAGNNPYDRRFMMSAGLFTMKPGQIQCISIAVPWARDTTGPVAGGALRSLAKLKLVDDKVQRLADSCFNIYPLGITPIIRIEAAVYPNPASDQLTIRFNQPIHDAAIAIYDAIGRLVKTQTHISGSEFSVSCKNFSSGIYFYKVDLKNTQSVAGKFMKQ